MLLYLN